MANNTDQILYWNEVALEANKVSHSNGMNEQTGPPLSSRALAMVHLAMYDAYVGTTPGTTLPVYLTGPVSPLGISDRDTAIATAACTMLSKLYPSQTAFFKKKYSEAKLDDSIGIGGHTFGVFVTHELWKDRKNDPNANDDSYIQSVAKGYHRNDPSNDQGSHAPFYGKESKCFAVTQSWALDPHPTLSSGDYQNALKQVIAKGIAPELIGTLPQTLANRRRTMEEELIGIFWGYDGAVDLGTPPRLYNQLLREISCKMSSNIDTNVLLFTMANVAMGDAGILAWEQKYVYNHWRPVVGVREHDISMGYSDTANNDIDNLCRINWLPLGAPKTNVKDGRNFTPDFPAYPSGHATFGAAALEIARLIYAAPADPAGINVVNGIDFISDEFNGVSKDNKGTTRPRHVRNFPGGIKQMIFENGLSRVFLGVHWYYDAFGVHPGAFGNASDGGKEITINEAMMEPSGATSVGVGGVPLGIAIARDIFNNGIKLSTAHTI
jgi:hypothetical protein